MTRYTALLQFIVVFAFTGAITGCADRVEPTAVESVIRRTQTGVVDENDVPVRGSELINTKRWIDESDSVLWDAGHKVGNVFVVGIKTPGRKRGIYHGAVLVDAATRASAIGVFNQHGANVLRVDDRLPVLYLRIDDIAAISRVRRLPFVDYLEPAGVPKEEIFLASGAGCDYPGHSSPPGFPDDYGDFISTSYRFSRVDRAWAYAPEAGAGVTVGLVDTGVDLGFDEFGSSFNAGLSSGRWIAQTTTVDSYLYCSHGTRMAGVIAAPRDGIGAVGIAYRANLYSSWGQVEVASTNAVHQAQAIRNAVNAGAKVVSMAWANLYGSDLVNDEIDLDYYVYDVVFVGAAGTSAADINDKSIIFFPASKSDVIAVSAADLDGFRDNQSHYGPELDLVAYHPDATVGGPWAGAIDDLSNSSSATAFVTGVAALVRGKYPFMSNAQVVDRLISTAGGACQNQTFFGPAVNAEAAVGGICLFFVSGPTLLEFYDDSPNCQTLTYYVTRTGGAGPFSYSWNYGNTSSTGESIQQTFCRPPTRDDDTPVIAVTVTDHGAGGFTKTTWIYLTIKNWSAYPCEERPDVNECHHG